MTAQLTPFPNLWNPCECREYSFRGIKYAGFASSRGKSPSPEKESKGELLHSQNTNVRFADSFRGLFGSHRGTSCTVSKFKIEFAIAIATSLASIARLVFLPFLLVKSEYYTIPKKKLR